MQKAFKFSDWSLLFLISAAALMGILHIAFGLSKVIDVMSGQTAAAWIQAIGSVAAIGVAIWVANGTERHARESSRASAKHFVRMANDAIGGLWVASKHTSEEAHVQKSRFLAELKEVQLIGQTVNLEYLESKLLDCVLTARTLVARCSEVAKDMHRFPAPKETPAFVASPRDGFTISKALITTSKDKIEELDAIAQTL
ncbi:hypothetical protein [Acidovorax sp. SUPP2539]|uniref:hypothetical protein n=1 Tax=Acidovorax sp. SUPP2539 TaxID=2920878 RepID=UPI0023DE3357|nr:hypothetical protein [Acidovorax sp. SUPP2539]GKS88327.1 hypothetical protein AVTE2539_03200 [Acidovorax sp. SUPP2539]